MCNFRSHDLINFCRTTTEGKYTNPTIIDIHLRDDGYLYLSVDACASKIKIVDITVIGDGPWDWTIRKSEMDISFELEG